MQIRRAELSDAGALAQVFFRAVREGPSPYTEAQRAAWMDAPPDTKTFAERLAGQYVILCEERGRACGFMTLDESGYIDLAFILHAARGGGAFRALYEAIEAEARRQGVPRLRTHASLSAQAPFQAMGFAVMHHEEVALAGQHLSRALMEKPLA